MTNEYAKTYSNKRVKAPISPTKAARGRSFAPMSPLSPMKFSTSSPRTKLTKKNTSIKPLNEPDVVLHRGIYGTTPLEDCVMFHLGHLPTREYKSAESLVQMFETLKTSQGQIAFNNCGRGPATISIEIPQIGDLLQALNYLAHEKDVLEEARDGEKLLGSYRITREYSEHEFPYDPSDERDREVWAKCTPSPTALLTTPSVTKVNVSDNRREWDAEWFQGDIKVTKISLNNAGHYENTSLVLTHKYSKQVCTYPLRFDVTESAARAGKKQSDITMKCALIGCSKSQNTTWNGADALETHYKRHASSTLVPIVSSYSSSSPSSSSSTSSSSTDHPTSSPSISPGLSLFSLPLLSHNDKACGRYGIAAYKALEESYELALRVVKSYEVTLRIEQQSHASICSKVRLDHYSEMRHLKESHKIDLQQVRASLKK